MKTTIDNQQETIEIEFSRELYDRVKRASVQEGISIDQWMLEAASRKLDRERAGMSA